MERQFTYQLKIRSEEELKILRRQYRELAEEIRKGRGPAGIGLDDIKCPDELYVERREIATGAKQSADISDCTYLTIYPLLADFRAVSEQEKFARGKLYDYLNADMSYEELNLLLKAAQNDGMPTSTISDILTPLNKYVEIKAIADFNAMKSRGERCNTNDLVRISSERAELQKMMQLRQNCSR